MSAQQLGELGASVVIFDRDESGATERASELHSIGIDCTVYPVDVADDRALADAVTHVAARAGAIDLLVNCAASYWGWALRDCSDWDRVLSVKVRPYANAVTYASQHMPPGSAIVNLASISAHVAQPNRWTYNASRGRLWL